MEINILGQGYEVNSENSVGNWLIKFFADIEFNSFTCISAFTSQAAIIGLSQHITNAKKHLKTITIVTGIDQNGTSKEALEELLNLKINAYVFYQPSSTIFHPKIYLFEGEAKSELIIGSSNLTATGLFTNVETSLHISIDNKSKTDINVISQLKDYFNGIFNFSDPNLKNLNQEMIDDLVKAKIVLKDADQRAVHDKSATAQSKEEESIVLKIFPKRALAKIPNEFRKARIPIIKIAVPIASVRNNASKQGELVWESGRLTERDLNIPSGTNTNPTGSMLFKKGKMKDIDQRHYFRDTVFALLEWSMDSKPRSMHLERAHATFQIYVDGINKGSFKLSITHNTRTETSSYKQKNSMTQLSWGEAKKVIAKGSLIGKSANLFRTKKPYKFILKIQ
jgi:HKD family nuclease